MIDFDKITNAEVNVGLFDKIFSKSSGSIIISTAGAFKVNRYGSRIAAPYALNNITNPYEVFKFFKKITFDVKTDMQYPNQYRPEINPGYNTRLKAK